MSLSPRQKLSAVAVTRGAHRIHHVREPAQGVIPQDYIGAYWIDNVCKVANLILFVRGRPLGRAPTVGQAIVRIVLVHRDTRCKGVGPHKRTKSSSSGSGGRLPKKRKGVRDDFWYMSRTNSQNIPLVIPDPFFLHIALLRAAP